MKKNLMSLGFLALCFLMMASFAMAIPVACNTIAPGTNVNPGGNTTSIDCTAGSLEFNNFQYTVAGNPGSAEIDLANVTVNGAWVLLNFNPNLGIPGNAITDLHFTFSVNGVVFGAAMANAGILSDIQEHNCVGANTTGLNDCTGTVIWSTSDTDTESTSCVGATASAPAAANLFPGSTAGTNGVCGYNLAGQNGISVWKDISIGVSGHNSSFTEGFLGNVPEPMTLSLMGAGLLGLGLLRRRMTK